MFFRNLTLIVLTGVAAAIVLSSWSADAAPTAPNVEHGKYLVVAAGCNDCHTPLKLGPNGPEPDLTRLLSGHPESMVLPPAPALPPGPWNIAAAGTLTAWSGPWGVSFSANLTPDAESGLGKWTADDFIATMRSGRHLGRGRQILPPMPYQNVASLSDADLHDVFAYLHSVPAIANRVPAPIAPQTR